MKSYDLQSRKNSPPQTASRLVAWAAGKLGRSLRRQEMAGGTHLVSTAACGLVRLGRGSAPVGRDWASHETETSDPGDVALVCVQMTPIEQFLIWRRRRGMSQKAAARYFGVSPSTIERIERGERMLPDENFHAVASPGEELWLMRRRHGLSTAAAAAILDCSVTQLYLLEHDKASIQYRDLTDIELAYRSGEE